MPEGGFARRVGTLAGGTALAQIIPILATPVLTRLYSPADFGVLALYLSCAAVLAVLATGRYEMAIPLPADELTAANIAVFTVKLSAIVSLLVLAVVAAFGLPIASLLGDVSLVPWLYFLPLTVFAGGVISACQFWCNLRSEYARMAGNRMQVGLVTALAQIGLGSLGFRGGQVVGAVIGQGLSAAVYARSIWHNDHQIFSRTSLAAQIQAAKIYLRHPAHIAPSQLIGVVAGIMPVFIMTEAYGVTAAGMLALALKLVALPTSLVASAIGDVYRQKIAQSYNETGQFKSIFVRTLSLTTVIAFIPFLFMYFLAPPVFVLIFGEAWREAGNYAQILTVAAFFQFIFTPVDKGAVVVGATRYIFAWHVVRMLGMLAVMAAVWTGAWSAVAAVWMIALLNVSLYVADGVIEYQLSRGSGAACLLS